MRQPHDFEQLLQLADQHDITLHGQANRRDLADPDDRFFLCIEVAHACRSSDDTSRRLRDATVDRARDGQPHGGKRRYGYDKSGTVIIETALVAVTTGGTCPGSVSSEGRAAATSLFSQEVTCASRP
ncbi:hypothetical protein [Streptomyces colonosanans]|nr:hypothetical protein [Streptomyces colonosanans]